MINLTQQPAVVALLLVLFICFAKPELVTVQIPISQDLKRILGYKQESTLGLPEVARRNGYKSISHDVITKDGYILKVFQLESIRCDKRYKVPVLLMHGLLLSAECFVDAGTRAGLAYLLADACFQIWIGNQRGTFHSRRHTTFNANRDKKFWDFSYQEMGFYDQPAFVDYILNRTGSQTLNYIGYSEGGAAFNIMCSAKPEYNNKIGVTIQLAPSSRMKYTRSFPFRSISILINSYKDIISKMGVEEMFARHSITQTSLEFLCDSFKMMTGVCESVIGLLDSHHEGSITDETLKNIFSHVPSGTSMRNFAHFGQAMNSDKFLYYDFGRARNLKVYGVSEPPEVNLSRVTVPTVMVTGRGDEVVDTRDVKWLSGRVSRLLEYRVVDDPAWNHFDTTYSRLIPEKIYPIVLKYLKEYSN